MAEDNGTGGGAVLTFPDQSRTLGSVPPLVEPGPLSQLVTQTVGSTEQPGTAVKQVAIIGYAPSSRDLSLSLGDDWERWGLNQLFQVYPVDKITRWFEIHDPELFPQAWPDGYVDWLNKAPFPVVVNRPLPKLNKQIVFPLQRLTKRFWLNGSPDMADERPDPPPYWTNSIAMMIAMAIDEGYQKIRVYGTDMLQETEYEIQRANCEAIIQYGRGIGVDIWVAPQSTLFRASHVYGYQPIPQAGAIDVAFLMGELQQLNQRYEQATQETQLTLGAKLAMQRILEMVRPRGAGHEPLIEVLEKEVADLTAKSTSALAVVAQIEGAKLTYERQLEMVKHYRKFGITPGFMDTGIVR